MENIKTIKGRISNKHGTESDWLKSVYKNGDPSLGYVDNPFIPIAGELIIYDPEDEDQKVRVKYGDGKTNVCDLPFYDYSAFDKMYYCLPDGSVSDIYVEAHGIGWKDGISYSDENNIGLTRTIQEFYMPIIAGSNIEFEVDEVTQVVRINATGGASSKITDLSDTVWTMNPEWTGMGTGGSDIYQWGLNFGLTINDGSDTWDEDGYTWIEIADSCAYAGNDGSDSYQLADDWDGNDLMNTDVTEIRVSAYGGSDSQDPTLIDWFYENGKLKGNGGSGQIDDLSNTVWEMNYQWTMGSIRWDLNFNCLFEDSDSSYLGNDCCYIDMNDMCVYAGIVDGSDSYTIAEDWDFDGMYNNYGVLEIHFSADGGSSAQDPDAIQWFYENGRLISGGENGDSIVPVPSVADAGKFLRVNDMGMPEWMTVPNAEDNLF